VLAAAVGGSRVYVGVHYPLDVIVGAGIGAAVATLSCRLWPSASSCTYPEMLDARRDLARRLGQRSAQLIALGRTLLKAEPLELTIDGERRLVWMGFVGNCRHEPAGFAPSWRPRLDDGCLDVRILLADLPLARPRLMLSILTGRLAASAAYRELAARQLRVESTRPRLRLACDGETFEGHGDFLIEKLPQPVAIYARHVPRT
jgi:diacylglycerol kinase family enzyme